MARMNFARTLDILMH